MLRAALLAGAERGINRVLRLDPTALSRLARLSGRVIEIDCTAPAWRLFILADDEGLRLAGTWGSDADCRLRAPASRAVALPWWPARCGPWPSTARRRPARSAS